MAEIIKMPKLSDTMTEGVVSKWYKKIGDTVSEGELLADIETDKATMEFESYEQGVLLHIGVNEGEAAPVDSVLAVIGEKGEDIKNLLKESAKPVEKSVEKEPTPTAPVVETTKPKEIIPEATSQATHGKKVASPLARKLAEERHINLDFIKGTGDNGRIVKQDIDNFNGNVSSFVGQEKFKDEPVSQMRKTIAKRLSESKFSAPHFYLTLSIDMDNIMATRKAINEIAAVKISFNDIVIKAVAASLEKHPKVNVSYRGDVVRHNEHVNIGVAIAVEDGLLVPVVRFANGKTLSAISEEVKRFAEKAKNKKLQPQDWEGSTFTVSNLGMFGIDEFTSIINTPDACILAVGGIQAVPVVKNGNVVAGNVMKVTLSCDHRAVDGATGAGFLKTLKFLIENPAILLGSQNI